MDDWRCLPMRVELLLRYAIAFLLNVSLIVALNAGGQEESASTADRSTTAKPLSGKIAFVALTDNFWQIWVLSLSDGDAHQITRTPVDKHTPSWNNSGDKIIYRTNEGMLERASTTNGQIEDLAPSLGFLVDPKLSPSGKRMVFSRFQPDPPDNTDLFVYSFETHGLIQLTSDPVLEYEPAWSPDETKIAFIAGRGRKGRHLKIMDANGKSVRTLQDSPADEMLPSWSPDGQWIVFASSLSDDYEIWRVQPDGQQLQQLTHSPGLDTAPCFAPDGSRIAFASNRDGRLRIWCMKPDGTDCQPLSSETIAARDPAWWQPIAPEHKSSKSAPPAEPNVPEPKIRENK